MVYEIYIPKPPLAQFITHFNYYKGVSPAHKIDRFLPNGNIEIVIDLTGSPKFIYDNLTLQEKQACNRIWISGIRSKYITIPSALNSEMFVINFRKGMVYPFLQQPLYEITDTVIDGDLILHKVFMKIRSALLEATSIPSMFEIAEQKILGTFSNSLKINPFIEFAVNKIACEPHAASIKKIADKTGYSPRHFIKIFRDHVGVNPKSFMRILRFQKAIEEIERNKTFNWINLAVECGYYDQSHFIADFRNFSGFTPIEYINRKNDTLNYVPVR